MTICVCVCVCVCIWLGSACGLLFMGIMKADGQPC